MNFVKITRIRRIDSNTGTNYIHSGFEVCEEDKLKSIISNMVKKYDNLSISDNDIENITKYIINKYNHKIFNLGDISSLIEKNKDVKVLSRKR